MTDPGALASQLRSSLLHASRILRRERANDQLSQGQLSILGGLHVCGPMTPSQLADRERVRPPSITRATNALEKAGLIVRIPDAEDRRSVTVALTDAGRDIVCTTRAQRNRYLAKRLERLTDEERDQLAIAAELINRIIDMED